MIWEFSSYRSFLTSRLGEEGSRTGLRKKLAAAISVHSTFVSQVLKGKADFSLEQTEAINQFFGHSELEGEYLILLVLKDRAGTFVLKKRFERKIVMMRRERMSIKKRLQVNSAISEKDRERFYSSYIYGAIHVLSAIEKFRSVEALSLALRMPQAHVREILDFMIRTGVLTEKSGVLRSGSNHIHLDSESELILKHHHNWRIHAINRLQFLNREDLHYSACLSLSHEDAFKVKESMLANLKSNVQTISKSPEETAYVMNLDFYSLVD